MRRCLAAMVGYSKYSKTEMIEKPVRNANKRKDEAMKEERGEKEKGEKGREREKTRRGTNKRVNRSE